MAAPAKTRESFVRHSCVEVRCSRCAARYEGDYGFTHFASRESAMETLRADEGWQIHGSEPVCFFCVSDPERSRRRVAVEECFKEESCVSVECSRCDAVVGGYGELHFPSVAKGAESALEDDWRWDDDKEHMICESCWTKATCAHEWPEEPDYVYKGMEYRCCPICYDTLRTPVESTEGARP